MITEKVFNECTDRTESQLNLTNQAVAEIKDEEEILVTAAIEQER